MSTRSVLEAEVDAIEFGEAAQQQARADHEHYRARQLDDDQTAADRESDLSRRAAATTVVERARELLARELDRRRETEDHAGQDRQTRGEGQRRGIECRLFDTRQPRGPQRPQHLHRAGSDDDPAEAAERRQHDALGQQLADDVAATRADRGTHRDLTTADIGAREQEVDDVGAGDQQDDRDRAEQDEQRAADVAGNELLHRNRRARTSPRSPLSITNPAAIQRSLMTLNSLDAELDAMPLRSLATPKYERSPH